MKKFSSTYKINEDINAPVINTNNGVSNHYTPVDNIIITLNNLFCSRLGITAQKGEDGISVKLMSSKFVNKEKTYELLNTPFFGEKQTIASFLSNNGFDTVTLFNLGNISGGDIIVYYVPSDIANAGSENTDNISTDTCISQPYCPYAQMPNVAEAEITDFRALINEDSDEDEELTDDKSDKILKVINSKDKIKAAKEFSDLISKEMDLPDDYYWAAVKDKEGYESIALRYKLTHRRPHGKTASIVRSIINIYGEGPQAVWIGDYDPDSIVKPTNDMKKLIENILNFLGTKKTNDPCIFSVGKDKSKDDESLNKENENESEDDPERDKDEDINND